MGETSSRIPNLFGEFWGKLFRKEKKIDSGDKFMANIPGMTNTALEIGHTETQS